MPSLLPGFEYDIFISYRQKDNKYDGWVTEFVDFLRKELEATFKEDISIYFDINPHDGLLDTHDVDASLKEKLKCLIFIPIVSQTYCDPKSFAWEHEFKAFVEQASHDRFGLKIKLPNGNVASRVLPVRIHDLDHDDIKLCETLLGGVLRSIDFIYKSAGVNRPLRSHEDHPQDNLNRTFYRDQINKVANVVKEIIGGMKKEQIKPVSASDEVISTPAKQPDRKRLMLWIIISILSVMLVLFTLFYFFSDAFFQRSAKSENITITDADRSIAVLPFKNLSDDPEQEYFSEGMKEEILNHLFKIGGLKIPSSSSSMHFKDSKLSIREIARKLGVAYVLEGNVSKSEDQVRVIVRLINGKSEELVWTEDYKRAMTATDILDIQSDVALQVAENLKVIINPEVKSRIKARPTENTEAYTLYLQAFDVLYTDGLYQQGMQMLERAVSLDPDFAEAYSIMALARMWHEEDSLSREQVIEKVEPLLNKAFQATRNSILAHAANAEYRFWFYWDFETVEKEFQIYRQLSPSNSEEIIFFVEYLGAVGRNQEAYDLVKGSFVQNTISESDFYTASMWISMALACDGIGEYEKAIETIETALRLYPEENYVIRNALRIFVDAARFKEAIALFEKSTVGKELKDLGDDILVSAGIAYFKTGNKNKGTAILNELLSRNRKYFRNSSSYGAAALYITMGEKDKAIQSLEKAYADRDLMMAMLKADSNFKPLHGDPRFEDLLKRIGFKVN